MIWEDFYFIWIGRRLDQINFYIGNINIIDKKAYYKNL